MATERFEYRFTLPDGSEEVFTLHLDTVRVELIDEGVKSAPDWAALAYHQCPHCPLDAKSTPYCPVAMKLAAMVDRFDGIASYETVHVQVETPERRISGTTTVQRGISSMVGLVMATSGCPHTFFFKSMARFHLPLATRDETLYRAASTYLLRQYFLRGQEGQAAIELDGLVRIYENIQVVNECIIDRLRSRTSSDSTVNGILILDMYAKALEFAHDDSLERIRHLFC